MRFLKKLVKPVGVLGATMVVLAASFWQDAPSTVHAASVGPDIYIACPAGAAVGATFSCDITLSPAGGMTGHVAWQASVVYQLAGISAQAVADASLANGIYPGGGPVPHWLNADPLAAPFNDPGGDTVAGDVVTYMGFVSNLGTGPGTLATGVVGHITFRCESAGMHTLRLRSYAQSIHAGTYTLDDAPARQDNALTNGSITCDPSATGAIEGHVYGNSALPGNELAGVEVLVCPTIGPCTGGAYTDGMGFYSARFLPDDTYSVTALPSDPFLTSTVGPVTVFGATATAPNIIMLPRPGAISGTVYLNVSGAGNEMAGATVSACTGGGACRTAVSGGDGTYTILYLADGAYNVTAVAPGAKATIGPVAVLGGPVGSQDIVVVTGAIEGHVYGSSALPATNALAGVVVHVCPTGGGPCTGSAYTDSMGFYSARFLPNGTYNVTALPRAPFLTSTLVSVAVSLGATTTGHDIIMPAPPGAISGTVYLNVSGAGNEMAGATVGACPTGGGACRTAVSGGDGAYTILYLADGPYNVTAVAPGTNVQATIGAGPVSGGLLPGQDIVVVAPTGAISGTVYHDSISGTNTVPNAQLQACLPLGPCRAATANGVGEYNIGFLPNGTYTVRVFAPGFFPATLSPVTVAGGLTTNQDLIVVLPIPISASPGTTLTPSYHFSGVPVVPPHDPLLLTKVGCAGAISASYQIIEDGSTIFSGPMPESPAGTYTATLAPLYPHHGAISITITLDCGSGPVSDTFNEYIDPSGHVKTVAGDPIVGATVTLLRSDSPFGPFVQVTNGSAIMSPQNQTNPDSTDAASHFGWDVIAGYYVVRASKPGCVSAADPSVQVVTWRAYAETGVLPIPPPVFDIDLRLDCTDTDGDGITDAEEIIVYQTNAANADTDGDGYTEGQEITLGKDSLTYCGMMRADVNDDQIVDLSDLTVEAGQYFMSVPRAPARLDQNGDNIIDLSDLTIMASVYFQNVSACP